MTPLHSMIALTVIPTLLLAVSPLRAAQVTDEQMQQQYLSCGMKSYEAGRDRGLGRVQAINAMFAKCKPIGLALEQRYGRKSLDDVGKVLETWIYRDLPQDAGAQ